MSAKERKERKERTDRRPLAATLTALVLALGLAVPALVAQEFTADFDRARCTFTTTGSPTVCSTAASA